MIKATVKSGWAKWLIGQTIEFEDRKYGNGMYYVPASRIFIHKNNLEFIKEDNRMISHGNIKRNDSTFESMTKRIEEALQKNIEQTTRLGVRIEPCLNPPTPKGNDGQPEKELRAPIEMFLENMLALARKQEEMLADLYDRVCF